MLAVIMAHPVVPAEGLCCLLGVGMHTAVLPSLLKSNDEQLCAGDAPMMYRQQL